MCSYIAWLYGVTACEGPEDLSRLISDWFMGEMRQSSFDPSPFLGKQTTVEELHDRMKLRFLLNFDKRIFRGLRPALAGDLGVLSKWNAIFGS